jgi:hypothetical protein
LCARKIRKWLMTPMSVFFKCLSPGFTVDLHSKNGKTSIFSNYSDIRLDVFS